MSTLRRMGQSDLQFSPLGLGSWQFSGGQGFGARFWTTLSQNAVQQIIETSTTAGINWIDTAEAYGHGTSEQAIAGAISALAAKDATWHPPAIADKWWPLGRRASSLIQTIEQRRSLLGGRQIDLYQIHHPTSVSSLKTQMQAMKQLVQNGDIRYVGVSNFSARQMMRAHALLQEEGMVLVSNQVRYNLFDRSIETNGVLKTAKRLGISIIAYSPLHSGLLTGKYHKDPAQFQGMFWLRKLQYSLNKKTLRRTEPLMRVLEELAQKHNCTPAQIALNWLINANGETVFAIPGASTIRHVQSNVKAMSFTLSNEEIRRLSTWA